MINRGTTRCQPPKKQGKHLQADDLARCCVMPNVSYDRYPYMRGVG